MTIAEKIQRAQEDLANVYEAGKAEGYEQGYNEGLAIVPPNYKKSTTGTITFASSYKQQTITHNLGVVPSRFVLYPLVPIEEMTMQKSYAWRYENFDMYGTLNSVLNGNTKVSYVLEYSTNTQKLGWQSCTAAAGSVDETKAIVGFRNASYLIPAGIEFGWIAIE